VFSETFHAKIKDVIRNQLEMYHIPSGIYGVIYVPEPINIGAALAALQIAVGGFGNVKSYPGAFTNMKIRTKIGMFLDTDQRTGGEIVGDDRQSERAVQRLKMVRFNHMMPIPIQVDCSWFLDIVDYGN